MSRVIVGAAALRRLRNTPLAASVAWRHLGRDPVRTVELGLRALPAGLRSRVADRLSPTGSGTAGALSVLALAADGRREEALAASAATARGRRLRHLVAAAVALHAPGPAREALERLPGTDADRQRLVALVAAEGGHLTAAAAAAAGGSAPATRRLHRRLAAELDVLQAAAGPAPQARCAIPGPGRPGVVLHLVTNSLPEVTAGYTTRTQGIAAAQQRAGLHPHVATRLGFPVSAGTLSAAASVCVDGVPHHRLLPLWPLPSDSRRLRELDVRLSTRLAHTVGASVLHAHSNHVNGHVALAVGHRLGLPVVYEVRGFLEETWRSRGNDEDADAYRLARAAETAVMGAADAVVTLSEGMAADIVSRGVDARRVSVVPNSVDDRFLAPPPDAGGLRDALGIHAGEVVVGTVSTLNDYEGLDVLIDAVALLRRSGAPVRLVVVGDGPAAGGLRAGAARLLGEAAVFTGRVPFAEVTTYHAALDVFCVPRLDRPVCRMVTPLKPLEAMAMGRPVVGSDLPPLREIVRPGRTGALAAPGDAPALAAALRPLIYDLGARTQMGTRARGWVAEHRSWARVARAYRDLYAEVGGVTPPV